MTDAATHSHAAPALDETGVSALVDALEPAPVRHILSACLAGDISPPVALMQLLIQTEDAARVRGLLADVRDRALASSATTHAPHVRERAVALDRLAAEHERGARRIEAMLGSGMDTSAPAATVDEGIAHCERLFDWSVSQSEETSVALYSLGSAEILGEATAEVVALFEEWGVLGAERDVLEIGCGIGRFQVALASRAREVEGIDVSSGMIDAARRRTAGMDNVHVARSTGRDLSLFEDARFDLVFAVDTVPYLVQSGMPLVEHHFAEARRVLRPGGDFVILNFSYRDDPAADRADVDRLAAAHGFDVLIDGTFPFALWNGAAWRMRAGRSGG